MNIQKEALKDASEFARAQVFYGEGAGNRRKLIKTAVAAKMSNSPAYATAFEAALAAQDMAKHVEKARKERHRRDVFTAFNRNTRNVLSGRYTGVNMAVVVLGGAAYYTHRKGYDKRFYLSVKSKIDRQREKRKTPKPINPKPVYHIRVV